MTFKKNLLFIISLMTLNCLAQNLKNIQQDIEKVFESKNATVGYAIEGIKNGDTISFNGNSQFPMQSVFKFHIAIVVFSEIDKGKLTLNQIVTIKKGDLLPGLYSPLREKYPNGTEISINELLEYTVSKSDNVGCDVLLKILGGPKVVENYFINNGFKDISIKINEETMQGNWDLQFLNWTTPKSSNQVLKSFYLNENNLLSEESHKLLWQLMKGTSTGSKRLKGKLPKGTIVAHKTGWSGSNKDGLTAAVNNVGIVFLPNADFFIISVFVSNSNEDIQTNEDIIASIAKITWDYYSNNE